MNNTVDINSLFDFARQVLDLKADSDNRELAKGFNVFRSLRRSSEEVRLHSRFIASLIDPKAPHGLGIIPLERLLLQIFPDHRFENLENVRIEPNYHRKSEHNNIDVLVVSDSWCVVIENKIWAGDSNHPDEEGEGGGQLSTYVCSVRNEFGFAVDAVFPVYLTVDGHKPSELSKGNLNVKTISYSKDITKWLTDLLPFCNHNLSIFINQYLEIINGLTMSDEAKFHKELKDLIGQDGNEDLRKGLSLVFNKERDILWHITSDLLWGIIERLGKTKHPVVRVSANTESYDDAFEDAIAIGLNKLFHRGSNGACIVLEVDAGESVESFYFGINNRKYQGVYLIVRDRRFSMADKERLEKIGYTVIQHNSNHHFAHAEKFVEVNGERLNLLSLGSQTTMNLTNRVKLEEMTEELCRIILNDIKQLGKIK